MSPLRAKIGEVQTACCSRMVLRAHPIRGSGRKAGGPQTKLLSHFRPRRWRRSGNAVIIRWELGIPNIQ